MFLFFYFILNTCTADTVFNIFVIFQMDFLLPWIQRLQSEGLNKYRSVKVLFEKPVTRHAFKNYNSFIFNISKGGGVWSPIVMIVGLS